MTYLELENLCKNCNGEVCLFGAGEIGKLYAYDLLRLAGFTIDFYCDNKVAPGTEVRDGIEVRDIQYLYENKDSIQVFLSVTHRYQKPIIEQLRKQGIHNVIVADYLLFSQVLDSIETSGDELVRQRYHQMYDDQKFLERIFEAKFGYKLNINDPKTYNEKLQWLKLFNYEPGYTRMVDKYGIKQFVEEKIGVGYTIPTLGVWDSFDEIDFDKLPGQFVLKCTHDSGSIVIVKDKETFNADEARRNLSAALQINYFWISREWPYRNVKRRIIAEPYLYDSLGNEIKDYKFFCFHGEVKVIEVDFERFINHKRNIYSKDWEYIPLAVQYPTVPEHIIEKPKCLKEMIQIAEKLSSGIPHIRVDFYLVDDKPIVGEMTFFHEGGFAKFAPQTWDGIWGDWIILPKTNKE